MNSNTHSRQWPGGLGLLATAVDALAAQDLAGVRDAEAARRVLVLRRLLDRLEGGWLRELAGVDGRGAAGTDHRTPAESTAAWLRHRTAGPRRRPPQRIRVARALHRGPLGGTAQALTDGRATRVVSPAQRRALAVRDGGCRFPGCDRPLAWCDAHHLLHWLRGGPTDLVDLVLVCRAHHRAVHEGGWRLDRHADGRLTAPRPTDDNLPPHGRRGRSRVDDGASGRPWTTRCSRTRHRWRSAPDPQPVMERSAPGRLGPASGSIRTRRRQPLPATARLG